MKPRRALPDTVFPESAMIATMPVRPCPTCRKPVDWEVSPARPFCSERCRTLDLGAWASETYRLPVDPADTEMWSLELPHGPGS